MKNKYLVTVGEHPSFDVVKYFQTEVKAQKAMLPLAREYKNTQVDMAVLDDSGNWEWADSVFICSSIG